MADEFVCKRDRNGKPTKGEPARFFRDVALPYTDKDCLPWPFTSHRRGYGKMRRGKQTGFVSRFLCEELHGPPPTETHHAAHNCGNAWCVNPTHITWKTPVENEADKVAHGTRPLGRDHPNAKLNEGIVREIRRQYPSVSQSALARRYGVRQCTIHEIINRKIWAWVT